MTDTRLARLINEVRGLRPRGVLETQVTGAQMNGFHHIRVFWSEDAGPSSTVLQGQCRGNFAEVVSAVVDVAPMLEEFLSSHVFAEVYDEVRGENELLQQTLQGILATLRRAGIFKL